MNIGKNKEYLQNEHILISSFMFLYPMIDWNLGSTECIPYCTYLSFLTWWECHICTLLHQDHNDSFKKNKELQVKDLWMLRVYTSLTTADLMDGD